MVPSRSRKTAGRSAWESGRSHLRSGETQASSRLDHGGGDGGHAAMIDWTAAKEAWAAMGLLPHDGIVIGDGSGAVGFGGAEYSDDWQARGGGDVHGARVVADEQMATRKECREIADGGLADEADAGPVDAGGDGFGYGL